MHDIVFVHAVVIILFTWQADTIELSRRTKLPDGTPNVQVMESHNAVASPSKTVETPFEARKRVAFELYNTEVFKIGIWFTFSLMHLAKQNTDCKNTGFLCREPRETHENKKILVWRKVSGHLSNFVDFLECLCAFMGNFVLFSLNFWVFLPFLPFHVLLFVFLFVYLFFAELSLLHFPSDPKDSEDPQTVFEESRSTQRRDCVHETLCSLRTLILPLYLLCVDNWSPQSCLGTLFVHFAQHFRQYCPSCWPLPLGVCIP